MSFAALKTFGREVVQAIIMSTGASVLVVDRDLLPSLQVVADMSFLTTLGIKQVCYINETIESTVSALVYLIGNHPSHIESMIRQYQRDQIKGITRSSFTCLCVPRIDSLHTRLLEQAGLYDIISLKSLPLELVPLDRDLACMSGGSSGGSSNGVEDYLVHGDPTCLYDAASAVASFARLAELELDRVSSLGNSAFQACRYLKALTADYHSKDGSQPLHVIFVDRRVDLITPLLTQLTYAGLLDEIGLLKAGVVKVPQESSAPVSSPSGSEKSTSAAPSASPSTSAPPIKFASHRLSVEGDPIFAKLSDVPFAKVSSQMKVQVRNLQQQMNKSDDLSISEMKAFVGRLSATMQEKRFVELHVKLASLVARGTEEDIDFSLFLRLESEILEQSKNTILRDTFRDLMILHRPLGKILRLLCLYSVINNGIKREHLEPLLKELLHSYGYDKLGCVGRLEQMGLLKAREAHAVKIAWNGLAQAFGLLEVTKFDLTPKAKQDEKKTEKSRREGEGEIYSYSNYFPLSAKLVHRYLFRPAGVAKYLDALTLNDPVSARSAQTLDASSVCLIFFVGGLCYSELAALRHLWAADMAQGVTRPKLLVSTTNILSGQKFVEP